MTEWQKLSRTALIWIQSDSAFSHWIQGQNMWISWKAIFFVWRWRWTLTFGLQCRAFVFVTGWQRLPIRRWLQRGWRSCQFVSSRRPITWLQSVTRTEHGYLFWLITASSFQVFRSSDLSFSPEFQPKGWSKPTAFRRQLSSRCVLALGNFDVKKLFTGSEKPVLPDFKLIGN